MLRGRSRPAAAPRGTSDRLRRDAVNDSSERTARLADNLARVRQRIAGAAGRAGRAAADVRLVAVTKYFGAEIARLVAAAGCPILGENRPQELRAKAESLADLPIEWHLIGSLQRNKVRMVLPHAALIHSADSVRLLQTLSDEAVAAGKSVRCLLEVNVSGDATKHGFAPDELPRLFEAWPNLPAVRIEGLMTMAALDGGPDVARANFAALRNLRDRLRPTAPPGVVLDELSMGMSGDFEIAIEEGATLVRVGSALYEGVAEIAHG